MERMMLAEDAALYFPVQDGEDVFELYEQILFDQKNFFLTAIPWTKTFEARFSRLHKINEAYLLLSGKISTDRNFEFELNIPKSDELREIINRYQENLAVIKLSINRSTDLKELIFYAEKLLDNKRIYASKWPRFESELDNLDSNPNVDPMLLIAELDEFESNGYVHVEDVRYLETNSMLYKEWIHLSLWLNKETEFGR